MCKIRKSITLFRSFEQNISEFEKEEKTRLEHEMQQYARDLETETKKEKDKHERNIQTLNKRKDELVLDRKQKMKACISTKNLFNLNSS